MKHALLIYAQAGEQMAAVADAEKGTVLERCVLRGKSGEALRNIAGDAVLALCPGGCLRPVSAGIYRISDAALADARSDEFGTAPQDRAMACCAQAAKTLGIPAYFTDAMSTDERLPLDRIRSNRNVAKYMRGFRAEHMAALRQALGSRRPEDGSYIVILLGDIVSIGAYSRGRCVDMNDCIGAEGPMGFTSSGDVPCAQLADYFAKTELDLPGMTELLLHKSGLLQYLGTADPEKIQALCETDPEAKEIVRAMAYQIAKWVGAASLVLQGSVQGLVLTGKGVRLPSLVDEIRRKLETIAPISQVEEPDMAGWLAEKAALLYAGLVPLQQY